jgi:hypothetical protein
MAEGDRALSTADEEILTCKVSDEALESAAGTGREKAGNWTFGACTGLDCGSNG